MRSARFTRRRMLGSVLAALTGWLMPRRSRTNAAPPQSIPPALHGTNPHRVVSTTYPYDGSGRLLCTTDYLTKGANNDRLSQGGAGAMRGNITAYVYDGYPCLVSADQADP